jgi:hypothetical protein
VYRVAPANSPYTTPKVDVSTTEGAIDALQSPNMSIRYAGWQKLHGMGKKAEKSLAKFYKTAADPRQKARALWLLSKLPDNRGQRYVQAALTDANSDLRITALRAARRYYGYGEAIGQ